MKNDKSKQPLVMTEAMRARPVDLRARVPKWLHRELETRAAARLTSVSAYVRRLVLDDVQAQPASAEKVSLQ